MDTDKADDTDDEITEPHLVLSATDREFERSGGYADKPVWSHVEMRIERAFEFGGTVRLDKLKMLSASSQTFGIFESITMDSLPERFRLIFSPEKESLGEKSNLREWWEPGEAPFRGTVRFGDDDWDARTVCSDVSVAKRVLKDFFEHGTLVDTLGETLSVWDCRPR